MSQDMKFIDGGVCAAGRFLAAGIHSGIKKNPLEKDLAIIFSEIPAAAKAVFTSNKIRAACISLSQKHIKNGTARAIIANSGNANCCTGKQGLSDARRMAEGAARSFAIDAEDVLVASTGVIGKPMPMQSVLNGIGLLAKRLGPGSKKNQDAARAIMTTDLIKKESAVRFKIGGRDVVIGGMAKGSGMISPKMATMLCFITTDAAIAPAALGKALRHCVERTFNSITVDGNMSTNDMAVVLANGAAGNRKITSSAKQDFNKFARGLLAVTETLAKMIIRDGEGATKIIEVLVKGAKSRKDASLAARTVCTSSLVKTAVYGRDANWGRVAASIGASGADISADKLCIYFGMAKVLSKAEPAGADQKALRDILSKKEVKITVDLGLGKFTAVMWTCDFSEKYVSINAKYRT